MAALFALSTVTFVALGVFGLIATATWFVADMLNNKSPRAEQRLEEIRDPSARERNQNGMGNTVTSVLEKATPALAKPLQPQKEEDVSNLRMKLSYAGFRSETAPTLFLSTKLVMLMVGLFLGGGVILIVKGITYQTGIYTIACGGICFYIPEVVLGFLGKRRKEAIFLGLPDALDLMVVCVEAGLALDQAMRKVSEEMKKSFPVIANEFHLCNMQLQMGRTRTEVLQELGQRTGVDDLRALASILIQADKFGSSVAQALRVQSESMRTKRRQIAEEKAAKTAVKLIFPLVIFIFPGIFIVLVGPAAITMVRELFPRMGGG